LTRRSIFLTAAALAFAALAACANPGAIGVQDTGAIVGRIIDAKTQQPVPGARILVAGVTQTVDGQGAFNITVPAGTQTIQVFADGYQPNSSASVEVLKDQTAQAGLIQLTPSSGP
jgi:hypothetical protein